MCFEKGYFCVKVLVLYVLFAFIFFYCFRFPNIVKQQMYEYVQMYIKLFNHICYYHCKNIFKNIDLKVLKSCDS